MIIFCIIICLLAWLLPILTLDGTVQPPPHLVKAKLALYPTFPLPISRRPRTLFHPMNSAPSIIFDLDGTLVDSIRDIAESMNRILTAENLDEKPLRFYLTAIGDGARNLLRRCMAPTMMDLAQENELLLRFKEDYAENLIVHTKLYPGIDTLLDELEERNIPKAIYSNKPDPLTQTIASSLLDDWSFSAVQGHHEGQPHKPDPVASRQFLHICGFDPASTWMVGDTKTDMDTATAAGMRPIGVSWGFRDEKELWDHQASTIIHSPTALLNLL